MRSTVPLTRRSFLRLTAAGLSSFGLVGLAEPASVDDKPAAKGKPTKFLVACTTLPYRQFPLDRALRGIQAAGYRYVALYTAHQEPGHEQPVPVLAADAPLEKAKEVGKRCRDLGLQPLLMFSGVYPDAPNGLEVLKARIRQASAAGVRQVLTFGDTKGAKRKVWIDRFKELGPLARDHGVLVVVKQHGGDTGTGAVCAEIIREVGDEGIRVNYDAGNVMDYTRGKVNPLDDIQKCAALIRSFCIKDHRFFPQDTDCGPGLGEIDHYRLLHAVAFTGLEMPLCCENISSPGVPRPNMPEGVDALARRAREFLELVIQGVQA